MSLLRSCYLCGKPVSLRRQMSVFCSARCEQRFRVLSGPEGPGAAMSRQRPADSDARPVGEPRVPRPPTP